MKRALLVLAAVGSAIALSSLGELGTMPDGLPGVGELGGPGRPLASSELEQFLRGREVFNRDFHRSDGVGTPEFNADSCRACHQDPILGGAGGLELNVSRCARDNAGQGPFENVPGGQVMSKLRTPWLPGREEYDTSITDVFEQRQTPSLFGGGLIDTIPDAEILSREDPDDLNGDSIRGVARRLDVNGNIEIGKFGWKGQVPRLADFIRDAMGGECGITTPDDGRGFALANDQDVIADPELSPPEFDDIHVFLSLLGPPPRGGSQDPRISLGESVFATIGCDRCHVPTLAGAGEAVNLYSDLLLHNVMPADFRGMVEEGAGSGVFRTPPLWGVGGTAPYLHDGRAETIEHAISLHDGEAQLVRAEFMLLTAEEKEALILFLEDL